METISIKFDTSSLEISTSNRREMAKIIYNALRESGYWVGCKHEEDKSTIYAPMEDEEKATGVIRSVIKGHPVFTYIGHHEDPCENAR
jgi:hypothetical protein